MQLRSSVLFLTPIVLTVGACFDPRVTLDTDTDGGADTDPVESADASTTDDGATTASDESDDAADSTGVDDAPPVVLAFTIDGSTMPNERDIGGQILLEADATDDVGVDRVEFYEGEELLASVAEPPYRTNVLLSSADNGSHVYSARAVDTAEQHGDSEGISLSVNIHGGEILELHEDIGSAYLPALHGLPRVTLDVSGDLLVTRTAVPNVTGNARVVASRFTADLSLLWDSHLTPWGSHSTALSPPTLTSTGEFLIGSFTSNGSGGELTAHRADFSDGAPIEVRALGDANGFMFPVTTRLTSGTLLFSRDVNMVEAWTSDLSETQWSQAQFPIDPADPAGTIYGLAAGPADSSLLTFVAPTPTCGDAWAHCLRVLSPNGTTLWTRRAAGGQSIQSPPRAQFDAQGHVYSVRGHEDGGVQILAYDPEGNEIADIITLEGIEVDLTDFAFDPQGDLIVVGYELDHMAWASRISPQGAVSWTRRFEELPEDTFYGSAVGGVTVSADGRVYLTGASRIENLSGFDYGGQAWVMEITL